MWDFPADVVGKNPPAMQGTQVQSLAWEDSRPQSNQACELQLPRQHLRACEPQPLSLCARLLDPVRSKGSPAPHREDPHRCQGSPCSPQLEKGPAHSNKNQHG